jgi:pimeloyl-ACP methyl ester carboxylesterase
MRLCAVADPREPSLGPPDLIYKTAGIRRAACPVRHACAVGGTLVVAPASSTSSASSLTRGRTVRAIWTAAICACIASAACGLRSAQIAQDRFFDSDGIRVRYQVSGQGTPVVLIHGFGETLERWQTAGVVRALTPHFQVIAMDVRGHGQSSKPHDPEAYGPALAEDVVRLLHHVGATKAHIVGYSMGALVALDLGTQHQESVLSIVLGGTGWIAPEVLNDFSQQADAYQRGRIPLHDGDDPKAFAALLRSFRALSADDLRRITIPMAALIGANDAFMSDVRRLATVLPTVQVVVIPGASHATALDHPAFAAGLVAFLQQRAVTGR